MGRERGRWSLPLGDEKPARYWFEIIVPSHGRDATVFYVRSGKDYTSTDVSLREITNVLRQIMGAQLDMFFPEPILIGTGQNMIVLLHLTRKEMYQMEKVIAAAMFHLLRQRAISFLPNPLRRLFDAFRIF
ncbi:MAG: hypothetical protein Q7N87_05375 [Candidatus Uhrbacteria bacterium]|nr:hypothetical protein [Candidatus Uhrbacteria bacterium]MDP3794270.1 hypothetical protein [Candidatus Uhrbacteria bacterium]